MRRRPLLFLATAAGTVLAVSTATAQETQFEGQWLFYIDHEPTGFGYGSLVIEGGDPPSGFIDGGPVPVSIDGESITLQFDWDNGGGVVSVSELTGRLSGDTIEGDVHLDGELTGNWRAERRDGPPGIGEPPAPVDLSGIWRMRTTDGTGKDRFLMTEAATEYQAGFDARFDDPVLRCVSDGLVRVTGGPFAKEIIYQDDVITVLHEDMHEIRRIWLDADFPPDVDELDSPLGFSVGHWEGGTLVVETRGLKPALWHRAGGEPISASARITEYFYLGDDGNLHVELTLDDPTNYLRSPERHTVFSPAPDYRFTYYACDPDAFYRGMHLENQLDEYYDRSRYRR